MKKSRFNSVVTYDHNAGCCFEKVGVKSPVIEGDAYTVRELFQRHLKGMVVNLERPSYFDELADFDSVDMHAIKYADPVDKAEKLLELQEKAERARLAIEKYNSENQNPKGSNKPEAKLPTSEQSRTSDEGSEDEEPSESGKRKGDSE